MRHLVLRIVLLIVLAVFAVGLSSGVNVVQSAPQAAPFLQGIQEIKGFENLLTGEAVPSQTFVQMAENGQLDGCNYSVKFLNRGLAANLVATASLSTVGGAKIKDVSLVADMEAYDKMQLVFDLWQGEYVYQPVLLKVSIKSTGRDGVPWYDSAVMMRWSPSATCELRQPTAVSKIQ